MKRLRILTWHIHGNYLLYLSRAPHEFFLPVKHGSPDGYRGRGKTFPFGDNVHDIAANEVRRTKFDCILLQSRRNFEKDQYEILSEQQLGLPRIYLEHDPPQEHPTNTRHWVDDPNILLIHVTSFNELMWDSGRTPTRVIDHGVFLMNEARYTGEIERGIVVINNLLERGRRLGADIFEKARHHVPLDLVGMGTDEAGGLGEIEPPLLAPFEARYRFFFNPIRYTSLGLAVIEAMMVGMPIIGLRTTEMATAIENGVSGYTNTNLSILIEHMHALLKHPNEARWLGENARCYAMERFNIERFISDWDSAFRLVTITSAASPARSAETEVLA
jgi:glycosyltransferase involved in cell wall biosynthesis